MSFWKTFGFNTGSAIDSILDGEDYTLEQLLDEEEIMQETKSQNKRLLDFFVQPETLKKLLYYITVEPEETDTTNRKFKYPFLACEILASEIWAICDAMYNNPGLLDDLYAYFENEAPLHPLLSSYTSRVACVLLSKKVSTTINYMKERKGVIDHFLKHLNNGFVMELLLKVISCEDTTEGAGTLDWLCTTGLIPHLVSKFEPSLGPDVHENAGQALVDIIIVSMNSSSSPLIAQLESQEHVEKLFGYILEKGLSSSLLNGLTVLIELLRRHVREHHDDETTLEQLPPILKLSVDNLEPLIKLLSTAPGENTTTLLTTTGKVVPLGFERLKIVEFISALFITNKLCIDNELVKTDILNTCLDLFFTYPWNNFLHAIVEIIIQSILEGENEGLKMTLVVDAKLIERIVNASKENDEESAKPRGFRKGYMGHLTAISHSLISIATSAPGIEKLLSENAGWEQFVKGELTYIRERENQSLAGYNHAEYGLAEDNQDFAEYDDDDDNEIVFEHGGAYDQHEFNPEENDFRLDPEDDDDDSDDDEDEEDEADQGRQDSEEDEEEWPEKKIKEEPATAEVVVAETATPAAPVETPTTEGSAPQTESEEQK